MTRLSQHALFLAGYASLLLPPVFGAAGLGSSNVAVYWGQNSYGQAAGNLSQQRLATYCENSDIDIIPMAFMDQVTTGTGTALIDCPQIGQDIKTCQQKYNKKILLSIGGATYTEGGFSNESAAVTAANTVWSLFGPDGAGNATNSSSSKRRARRRRSSSLRPFGDAVVDGFDFDFETTVQNTVPFATQLRTLMAQDTSKEYYLTAAPQCVYPDAADQTVLDSSVVFDAVFVQFYNNYCGGQSFVAGAANQTQFDFSTWDNWAQTTAASNTTRVFLGVPANTGAAGSGYLPPSQLEPIIEYCKTFASFGGVMMWDASQAYANEGFLPAVKTAVT